MSSEKLYTYEPHGHSTSSDGWSTPHEIVTAAITKGIDLIGISDHDSVSGLIALLQATDAATAKGYSIFPVPSVEVSTKEGHVIVSVPDRDKAEALISTFKKPAKKPYALDLIENSVDAYDAICILAHPNFPRISSLSYGAIDFIAKTASQAAYDHLALEVSNWMTIVFLQQYKKNIFATNYLNENQWQFAEFGGSDYHTAGDVGNTVTTLNMPELSAQAVLDAVRHRKTSTRKSYPTIKEVALEVPASFSMHVITKVVSMVNAIRYGH